MTTPFPALVTSKRVNILCIFSVLNGSDDHICRRSCHLYDLFLFVVAWISGNRDNSFRQLNRRFRSTSTSRNRTVVSNCRWTSHVSAVNIKTNIAKRSFLFENKTLDERYASFSAALTTSATLFTGRDNAGGIPAQVLHRVRSTERHLSGNVQQEQKHQDEYDTF